MLSIFDATMIAEGAQEPESQRQYLEAWALLIKTGTCWELQGFFGRTASALIERGIISPDGEIDESAIPEADDDEPEEEAPVKGRVALRGKPGESLILAVITIIYDDNNPDGAWLGNEQFYETDFDGDDIPGVILANLKRDYGRCTGKMYEERETGDVEVGYVFVKRVAYHDNRDKTYLQESLVTLCWQSVEELDDEYMGWVATVDNRQED